ncbi:GNAT family N-acetyltransferase [Vibrio sp. TH_r3]|uniref:GNAT family N-acetyltransferase n=1 Tax=Vibrio sp. TH_r3 TaxID=3082084 RepID=UPI002953383E|nr:GNAT family N-acetyltransferase [Vibrio sp. TH_r3]MDV7104317.1 GNAT family N-acetyltransferase [Vibrio sp. TH_r3]
MNNAICIKFVAEYEPLIRHIRHSVFTLEQKVDSTLDFDGLDSFATHALIYDSETPVATGRLLDDGHIGRVAVLSSHRGLGYGKQVISALERYAVENHYPRLYLGAQLHAESFYAQLGFSCFGEQYTEANIEHISMQKQLLAG